MGDGNQKEQLQKYVYEHSLRDVYFLGTQKNKDIPMLLSKQDVLILPSLYDGWGAVVNEALIQGLYVICSDRCGAKELLVDKRIGMVFKSGKMNDLSACLEYCIKNADTIRHNREYRKEWTKRTIHGKVMARYMIDCLEGKAVKAPWFEDNTGER